VSLRGGVAFLLRRVAELLEPEREPFADGRITEAEEGGISRSHPPAELSPEGQRMIDRDAIRQAVRAQRDRANAADVEDDMDRARRAAAERRSRGVR
jgi:hypothetical protein